MSESAIPPSGMSVTFQGIKKQQETLYDKLKSDDEEFWAELPKHGTYEKIRQYIINLCDGLDELEGKAIDSGATTEEIGFRRLINRLTKANLMSLITKVEKTVEAVKSRREQKGRGT